MKRYAFFIFAFLTILGAFQAASAETKTGAGKTGVLSSVATSPKGAASPTSALASLGFTVFPEAQPIPAFSLKGLNGEIISIGDLKGKYVFLNFWATWCPPCQREMPSMEALYAKFKKKNFALLAISVREEPKTVQKYMDTHKYAFPIALDPDGAVSSLFVGRGIPTTYILDPQGRAIAGLVGGREWNTKDVYDVFEGILEK